MKKNIQYQDIPTIVDIFRSGEINQQEEQAFTYETNDRQVADTKQGENSALPAGVVPIQSGGTDTALFMIHDVSGEVFYAQQLTHHIGADIPVYGLVDTALNATPFRTMHARARRLVRIIRAVQPFGPYRVASWAFGGNLAYEIATQLLGEDETIAFLGLIDSFNRSEINRNKRPPVDDNTVLLNYLLSIMAEIDVPLKDELETIARTTTFETLVQTCQQKQLLPPNIRLENLTKFLDRMKASHHALEEYHPQSIPIPIHLFRAMVEKKDATTAGDDFLGWGQALPQTQINVIQVPGTHDSMMFPLQINVLGSSLNDVLQQSSVDMKSIPAHGGGHLVTIQVGQEFMCPVFCVPGAGANVTDFIPMAVALGDQWTLHGLQPRGSDNGHVPHATVPAAASAYLRSLDKVYPNGPLHLLGHSFGGWVVFEMALRLRAEGRKVDTVTLIDAEAPESNGVLGREYNHTEIFMQLVELSEQRSKCSLNLKTDDFDGLNYAAQLKLFHERLVAVGMVSHRSTPEVLSGMVRIFATNIRTTYVPSGTYSEPVRLVLVRTAAGDVITCRKKYKKAVAGWQRFAPGLVMWRGPGNHMTVLNPPHVDKLSDWLRAAFCSRDGKVHLEVGGLRLTS